MNHISTILCRSVIPALVMIMLWAVSGQAAVLNSCTSYCHGMPPKDAARKGNPHYDSRSSAVLGNHQTHLTAAPSATDCSVCHAAVAATDYGHQNNVVNMAASIKGGTYAKGTFFNQTSVPNLTAATCSTVSCHFERTSPNWGTATVSCATCHDATPTTLSHPKHTAITACSSCHTNHSAETKPYAHATSAGRPITVTVGSYAGSNNQYLPSQAAGRVLGSCTTAYCHSTVQGIIGSGAGTNNTIAWGSITTLTCGSCHPNMSTSASATGSHVAHAQASGTVYGCDICHGSGYSAAAITAPATTTHANSQVNLSFTGNATGTTYTTKGAAFAPGSAVYSTCASSNCHGAGTPTWGAKTGAPVNGFPYSATQCEKCHGSAATNPFYSTAIPKVTLNTDVKAGAHTAHLFGTKNISSSIACTECHTVPGAVTSAGHMDGTTQLVFGVLAKSQTTNATSCATTWCHGGNTTLLPQNAPARTAPNWGTPFPSTSALGTGGPTGTSGSGYCAQCHGYPPLTTAHTGKTASTCIGCHPHLNSDALTFNDKTKHVDGTIQANGHAFPYSGALHLSAAGTTPWSSCSGTGCHSTTATGVSYATWAATSRGSAPNCTTCHTGGLKVPSGTSSCYDCHGSTSTNGQPNGNVFPNTSGSHSKHIAVASLTCSNCHNGFGAGSTSHGHSNGVAKTAANVAFSGLTVTPTWTPATHNCSASCHIAATWGTRLGCIDCHSVVITRTKGRPGKTLAQITGIGGEFGLAWGHKNSTRVGTSPVSNSDCIVCHLEGLMTTGKTTAYHGDGNIDLRDHNSATNDVAITDLNGTPFTFQRFSTSYQANSRTVATADNKIDNIVTRKFCLGCHKSGGSSNTTAGQGGIVAGGSKTSPFATAGTTLDVASQFATTNRSKHPVLTHLTRDFPTDARLADPYKPGRTTASQGTRTTGKVINCFDCHNIISTTPAGGWTLRTVSAHGNAVTVRGTIMATTTAGGTTAYTSTTAPGTTNQPTLCKVCHIGYDTSTASHHGAGSALNGNTNGGMTNYLRYGCNVCHSSGYTTAVPRPTRAADVHGSNVLGSVGALTTTVGRWSTDPTPVAFIRNRQQLGRHAPFSLSVQGSNPAWSSGTQCMGNGASPCNQGNQTYSVGGTY